MRDNVELESTLAVLPADKNTFPAGAASEALVGAYAVVSQWPF
jgi:hypothetical protein